MKQNQFYVALDFGSKICHNPVFFAGRRERNDGSDVFLLCLQLKNSKFE